jgi:cell division topological specificity factor
MHFTTAGVPKSLWGCPLTTHHPGEDLMPLSFIERLFGKGEKSAKTVAKDRLRLVLMHDRADIPAPMMEEMRREILLVLSKYVDIDENALEVNLERADNSNTVALVANIPIRRVHVESPGAPSA